jgi:serine carboxypeptidase-like clade 2
MEKYIRFPHPVFTAWRENQLVAELNSRAKRDVPAPDPCIDNYVTAYLNKATVQKAIHAHPLTWVECGGPQYTFFDGTIIPLYKEFMDKTKWKILVYSGDEDTVINFISTESWINALKRPTVSQWAPWYHLTLDAKNGKQVAGWRVVFDRIEYRTVKGAGHMVPWWQPSPALTLLKDFINA